MENDNKDNSKKENKHKSFQMHVRLELVIFILAVAAFVIIAFGIKTVIVNLVADSKLDDVKTRISENAENIEYLVNSINLDTDDTEKNYQSISALVYDLSARIIIVNTDYNIEYDSFNVITGTYIMDNDVHDIMNGATESLINNDDYISYVFPVVNQEGYIDDVVILAVSLSDWENENVYLSYRANIVVCIFLIFALICAFVVASLSVRDTKKLSKRLTSVKDGFLAEIDDDGIWHEASVLTGDFNEIFSKFQALEESRQEFVSNVSHELKTPITSMKVLSESILMQENVPAETYREFMNDIVLEIDREAQIISDLLTLVKTERDSDSLNIENVDINELMEIILKRLTPLAQKRNIEIIFESFREVFADIDKVKFTLAISNLIENGIKYNVDGGKIRVSLNADHKNLYIKVADTGVGIPEDCIDHIFERFYRVDKARSRDTGGTGLGLAISRNIIIMHKGTINVYSEPGKGTTFTVKVPMNYIK